MSSTTSIRLGLALLCLAAALWTGASWRQEHRLTQAADALAEGRTARGAELAAEVDGAGTRARAARARALAAVQQGDLALASRELATAIAAAPNDWALHRDRAVVLQRRGLRGPARAALQRALQLNPRLQVPPGFRLTKSLQP